jgi:hypothetical protein
MKICILGCGPAGLLVAEAVSKTPGYKPIILSRKVPSTIFGAQFLHRQIPGITSDAPDYEINVIKTGTKEGYAYNTYGDAYAPVSWDAYEADSVVYGWNLRTAYERLWDKFRSDIFQTELDGPTIAHLMENYPIIYSTLPLRQICRRHHLFEYQDIWVQHGDANGHLIEGVNDGDYMYYNGNPPEGSGWAEEVYGPDWYRFSQLSKYQSWEYRRKPGTEAHPDWYNVSSGVKPLSNNCDCWSELRRVGRFGRWEKGQLTHHAYEQVLDDLLEV